LKERTGVAFVIEKDRKRVLMTKIAPAGVFPGDSGSPLICEGQVVGVISTNNDAYIIDAEQIAHFNEQLQLLSERLLLK
jgi:hypothetical protein